MEIKKNDIIHFKPEFMDAGDQDHIFIAVEDADGDRVKVACLSALENFVSMQVVNVSMIDSINQEG